MFIKKPKPLSIIAPVTGKVIPLEESTDPAFAEKLVGNGIAIMPVEENFVCPADGRIAGVAEALHAYSIETPEGIDLLIHIGMDTVELRGEGFETKVKVGDIVSAGDPLCKVDLELLRHKGYSLCSPVVICDTEKLSSFITFTGDMIGGADTVIEYTVKK